MYESSFAPVLMFWAVMLVMYSDSAGVWGALLVEVGGEVVVGVGGVGGLALYEVFDDGFDLSCGYLLAGSLLIGVAGLACGS